jgi:methylmalonyl-CoA/ethylmalonyl-CoA epimerase
MIGRLNHLAIAVPDLAAATALYRDTLGATVSDPLGEGSTIAKFLERTPGGGMHHICFEVEDIIAARDQLRSDGARVLGDGEPRIGAHGKPVLFLHPKDFCGTLIEIEQL